jgi:hypothetical protein
MTEPETITWLDWGPDAFARAAAEQKPVLLAIGAAWCRWTEQMERVSFRDPRVVRLVTQGYVPVRVDADRRPDVSERYTLGGWPTTAFLTPSGEILSGGTYLEPQPLAVVLEQVAGAFAAQRTELEARISGPGGEATGGETAPEPAEPEVDDDAGRWLEEEMLAGFDHQWGGFGTGAKRVHADALAAALRRCRETENPDLVRVVTHTLDAIVERGLRDPVDGGFFRYCEGRDWSAPHVEKVLTVHARLLELYLLASQLLDRPDYADHAAAMIRFVHTTFADTDGGFFASQRADPAYVALLSAEARRDGVAPPVDRTLYTDGTAVMASAYVLAASVLADNSLLEFAAKSIDRVVLATYERGGGVGHHATGTPVARGLLTDHVAVSAALLDLYEETGQDVYLDLPRELMAYCQQTMWHDAGGFTDRGHIGPTGHEAPLGLLRHPHRPVGLNCRAATVLVRLWVRAEEPAYRDLAVRTLASQTPAYREHGLDGAAYVLALDQLRAADSIAGR